MRIPKLQSVKTLTLYAMSWPDSPHLSISAFTLNVDNKQITELVKLDNIQEISSYEPSYLHHKHSISQEYSLHM